MEEGMNQKNIIIIYNFPLIILIIIFLVAIVPLSTGENEHYIECSFTHSCDDVEVGYPFWGYDRPSFCGIPQLYLDCNSTSGLDHLTSRINIFQNDDDSSLLVLSINTTSHTINAISSPLHDRAGKQPPPLFERCLYNNVTLLSHLKLLSNPNNDNISSSSSSSMSREIKLFYGCAGCDHHSSSKRFSCSNSDGTNGVVYYFSNLSDVNNSFGRPCSCNNSLTLPVGEMLFNELVLSTDTGNASLSKVLAKWPGADQTMEYIANFTECTECEDSGGTCGSSVDVRSDPFVCYCPDGSYQPFICTPVYSTESFDIPILVGVVAGISAILTATVIVVALLIRAKRKKTKTLSLFLWSRRTKPDQNVEIFLKNYGSLVPKRYTYVDVRKITMSFKTKLGEGGYGSVYKGQLHDGHLVAVKILKNNLKGDGKDFINEVLSISRTNHVNVVTLIGFCFEGTKRALIFEFLPNGSLEKYMYGKENEGQQSLQCETILKIALGIARGLDYLHRGCTTRILHFDIKPHNILLDKDFNPKISDFGLARLCSPKNSMVSMSDARGTIGYIAPEVFCRNFGGVSYKSDVYSYGMMLLDLVCGRNNNLAPKDQRSSEMYFPEWIYDQLESSAEVVTIQGIDEVDDGMKELKRKMILVSLWCIQTYPSNRPPMSRVVEMLEGPLESLQIPPKFVPQLSSPTICLSDSSPMLQSMAKDYEDL